MTTLREAREIKKQAPMSVFTAKDNIKYRKYRNQMALQNKQTLAKAAWAKAGKPIK